jgi:DNA-binding MarR family transcriptional regulator
MNSDFFDPDRARRFLSAERFEKVQSTLKRRARRFEYLRTELLNDPAWDILLELYAFDLLQHQTTLHELTERIKVPSTTSIRWVKMLEAENLIARTIDHSDAGAVLVALTGTGFEAMDGYFAGL